MKKIGKYIENTLTIAMAALLIWIAFSALEIGLRDPSIVNYQYNDYNIIIWFIKYLHL
jgi:hypothetical protein